jgi:hypothetical protein
MLGKERCQIRNGGAWDGRADGYVGAYFCDRGDFVLAGPDDKTPVVDRSSPRWSVKTGPLGGLDELFPEPAKVFVTTAYLAGTP